jgi:hypothetical protein
MLQYFDMTSSLFPALGHDVSRLIWLQLDAGTMCRMRRVCTAWFIYVHREWPWHVDRRDIVFPLHVLPPAADQEWWVHLIVSEAPPAFHAELMFLEHTLNMSPRRCAEHAQFMTAPSKCAVCGHHGDPREIATKMACEAQLVRVWERLLERSPRLGEMLFDAAYNVESRLLRRRRERDLCAGELEVLEQTVRDDEEMLEVLRAREWPKRRK